MHGRLPPEAAIITRNVTTIKGFIARGYDARTQGKIKAKTIL
jgi:hypothetical protein